MEYTSQIEAMQEQVETWITQVADRIAENQAIVDLLETKMDALGQLAAALGNLADP